MSVTLAGRAILGSLFALALAPAGARADVIAPPTGSCPPGSVAVSGHVGYCRVALCEGSGRCEVDVGLLEKKMSPGRCEERKLCLDKVTQKVGWAAGRLYETAVGSCSGDSCRSGTCKAMRVCVLDRPEPNPFADLIKAAREKAAREKAAKDAKAAAPKGCGCSLDPQAEGELGALVLLVAAWLGRRRAQ